MRRSLNRCWQGALAAGLGTEQELFVNIELGAARVDAPDFAIAARDSAAQRLRVSVEITERALMNNPAELMASLAVYRQLGWRSRWTMSGSIRARSA